MNSIFKDVLELKKASKFVKEFDQHCYVARFETLSCKSGYKPSPPPPDISPSIVFYVAFTLFSLVYNNGWRHGQLDLTQHLLDIWTRSKCNIWHYSRPFISPAKTPLSGSLRYVVQINRCRRTVLYICSREWGDSIFWMPSRSQSPPLCYQEL